jgi:hypothetical protein
MKTDVKFVRCPSWLHVSRIEENNVLKLEFLGSQNPPTWDGFSWGKAIETSGGMLVSHRYYEDYIYRP